ncbi:MAG TPA: S41 family peptidase [Candidatus Sulfopaludibacter sp.]|jgi:tricorn protease|nr:S41 family peptidase [Candidatus Sulfopaludibacter sp.]
MFRKALLTAVALLLPVVATAQTKLLRYPTYSKGKIAFSYLGDIWTANENGSDVHRITVNRARDQYPRFSPDGQWIAFSSSRDGNYDVYVVPAAGGEPKQLTFNSANDDVVGWSTDGKRVVFSSTRGNGAFPSVATLWEVPVDGGIERALNTDWGAYASYSPDGAKLAFQRHPSVWSRKHYRGSYAADLWVEELSAKKFTKLGDEAYHGNMLWPMYGNGGEIYFVSNELANEPVKPGSPEVMKSVNNIWKISDKGGKPAQVTHHTDGNLFYPSISADGKTIVYEDDFGLWKLDVASGKSTEIRLEIKSDYTENKTELTTISNELEGFGLSPSNKRAAVAVHGEIFTIATDRGQMQRVTETPWKEQSPHWSPDGKWIAYISDRTGREEIYISDELGKNLKKLTDADCDKVAIVWAADSKSFLWTGSDHKLRRLEIESGKEETLASSPGGNIGEPQFSPDGKWVSYSKPDDLLRTHVFLKELATGQEHMVTSEKFLTSRGAKWTPDGKKLLVIGGQGGSSGIASTGGRGSTGLYAMSFTPLDKDPSDRDINTEAQAEAADATAPAGGRGGRAGAGAVPANVQVKIDWTEMERRVVQLAPASGNISMVLPSPDGHTYLFQAGGGGAAAAAGAAPGMYTMNEDGSAITHLNTTPTDAAAGRGRGGRGGGGGFGGGAEPTWARDGRSIYFMQGGSLYNLSIGGNGAAAASTATAAAATGGRGGRGGRAAGGATAAAPAETGTGPAPRRVDVSVRLEIDIPAERRQVFEEAWRVMKNRFYDAKMHGADWAGNKDKYESLLPYIADTEELHNVIMEMIGDMNASHTGISAGGVIPGRTAQDERVQTRYPGFEMEPDASGFYKVSYIYRKGPADHDYVKLSVGDYILGVNDKDMKTSENYWKLFNILPGRKFDFLVNSKPSADGAWVVSLDPLTAAAQADLRYERWVDDRKNMVRTLSGGEIGYLHIKAMDAPSLAKFQLELAENQDKKALIIDERFNGGGGIDQELLEILNQRVAYQSTRNRDSLVVKRPAQAFFGPLAVLQNERSASDAEMFPAGIRDLKLGKIIGVPTMGAVIGTGSFTLMDGSVLRTPGAGVYTASGQNMENYGVPPDIWVDNTPADFLAGHDRQIEKAVETLKGQLK